MKRLTKFTCFATLLAASTLFAGCKDDDGSDPGSAWIRAIHAASGENSPTVDIWVDGAAPAAGSPLDNLEFGDATPYIELTAGAHEIAVVADGSTLSDTDDVFFAQQLDLTVNTETTVYAFGEGTASNVNIGRYSQPALAEGEEVMGAPTRVIHAAGAVGAVDVIVNDAAVITNLAPGSASQTRDLEIDTPYVVGVAESGEDESLFDFDVTIPVADRYAVFAANGEEGLVLLAVTSDGTVFPFDPVDYSYIRVFHGANANDVDVWASPTDGDAADEPIAEDLGRLDVAGGDFDGYYRVRADQYDLAITAAGAANADDPALEASAVLDADQYYTAFAYGDPGSTLNSGVGIISDDRAAASDGNIAHSSSAQDPVILYLDGDEITSDAGVLGGAVSEDNEFETGSLQIGVSDTNARNAQFRFTFDVEAGVADFFVVGLPDSEDYPFQVAYLDEDNDVVVRSPDAELRVLHISDTNEDVVDVYVGGELVFDDLARRSGTALTSVPSGFADIEIYEGSVTDPDSATPVLSLDDQNLAPGGRFTVSLYDSGGINTEPTATFYVDPLQSELPASIRAEGSGNCALRVVHNNGNGTVSSATVDTYFVNPGTDELAVGGLTLGDEGYYTEDESTDFAPLAATTGIRLGIDIDEDGIVDREYINLNTTACESELVTAHLGVQGALNVLYLFFNDGSFALATGQAPQ